MVTSLSDTPLQMPTITVKPTDRQTAADQPAAAEKPRRGLFGPEGFSFSAFLDIINPLQHIPVVSTIYRAVTGDTIENGSRLIGGTLFGGPIGFIASAISGMIEESTGKDVGDHVLAFAGIDFGGQKATAPAETGLAEATRAEGKTAQNAPTTTNAQNAQVSPNGSSLETILASGRGGLDDIVWTAPRFATPENPAIVKAAPETPALASAEMQQNAQRAREIPIGALSDLAQRAWGDNAQVASANPAASAPIRAGRLDQSRPDQSGGNTAQVNAMPAALAAQAGQEKISGQVVGAAPSNTAAGNDGRQWYPAFPQQGGVAVRSVGTQPVGPQNAAVKSGTARGVTYSQTGTAQTGAASNQADLAERANAAYQKYLDLKERQSRERTMDQSF